MVVPTDPIRWGILGSGRVAHGFAAGLQAVPDSELAAVASRRLSNAEAFAERHGGARVHERYDDLVADPDIDVIYVATPNDRHVHDALNCLAHGKAVLCEKPFTVDSGEARQVIDAARSRGVFCMEGMWMRFIPAVQRAIELVESGAIGDVRTVAADFSHPVRITPGGRMFDPELGGGALLDLGVYTLSLAQSLLGEPAQVASHLSIGATGVDEHASVSLGYENGAVATLTCSLRARGPNRAVIAGSTGTIHLPGPICAPTKLLLEPVTEADPEADSPQAGGWLLDAVLARPRLERVARSAKHAAQRVVRRGPRSMQFPLAANGYNYEAAEVARCLRAGELESPVMPLDESLRTIALIEKIRADHGLGRPLPET